MRNAPEIAGLEGIDCIYYGTYDIASSLKIEDQAGSEVKEIIKTSISALEEKNVVFGQVAVDCGQFNALDKRINFVPCGVDCGIILSVRKIYCGIAKVKILVVGYGFYVLGDHNLEGGTVIRSIVSWLNDRPNTF